MKFIVLKKNLKDGLRKIEKISTENSQLPILQNFLIESVDNKIKIIATNLELAITTFIAGKIITPGSFTIPLNIFNFIINNIQSEKINLELEKDKLLIKTDNYQAEINGIKKEEFPIIPEIANKKLFLEIPNIIFQEILLSVINSCVLKNSKQELNGVLFDYQINFLKLASTDTFRLSEKTIYNKQFNSNINLLFKAIIPLETIQEIIKELQINENKNEKTLIYFDQNQVLFKINNTEIISRLISGDFPEYQPIIPKNIEIESIINNEQFINAIKLSRVFTDKFNEIKLIFNKDGENLEIYSSNQNIGENKYIIPLKNKIDLKEKLEIVFNWQFLLDGVKNIESENIYLGLNTFNKPIIIKNPSDQSWFYILMPLKT